MALERRNPISKLASRLWSNPATAFFSFLKAKDPPLQQEKSNHLEIDEKEFNRSPQQYLDSAIEGTQISVKDTQGKVRMVVGSTGRNLFPELDISNLLDEEEKV